ncbi:hypothetical protein LJC42_04355 [Eubacteriales bacterium OttesenSCG-928-K08]|nr:hypothetical protein [Eubacteriales bacterium OttesenSCG-928-K08]
MQQPGVVEINLHGYNKAQAQAAIDAALKRAGASVYRIRLIHGYHQGTELRDMIRSRYRKHPKTIRLELGLNQGQTELVLREF